MKTTLVTLMLIIAALSSYSQPLEIKLKYSQTPESNNISAPEEYGNGRIINISEAKMYVYLPEKSINTGVAVIICPGGAYRVESIDHEGHQFAEWLSKRGIAGIVLKYRLPNKHPLIPILDAITAIRTIRLNAKEWNIDPEKIGIGGFSAGGHLAATLATHYKEGDPSSDNELDRFSSRPDFQLLLYPVISMQDTLTHKDSRTNLLGDIPDEVLVNFFSNELQISAKTPPAFIALTDDDEGVSPLNSINYYTELRNYKVPAEMHIFSKGGHGFGMTPTGLPVSQWPDLFYNWLKTMQFISNK
ncbi:MAG: alpha/beta hydrolase [Bacteroidota bacterium]|nr:alpha/beta hydrolase [Bacteroidota bacterium]